MVSDLTGPVSLQEEEETQSSLFLSHTKEWSHKNTTRRWSSVSQEEWSHQKQTSQHIDLGHLASKTEKIN